MSAWSGRTGSPIFVSTRREVKLGKSIDTFAADSYLPKRWSKGGRNGGRKCGGVHLSALTYADMALEEIGTCQGREVGPNFAGAAALFKQRSRFVRTSFSYDGEVHRAAL